MKRYLILGSGIALGVYVPALSVKKQLESLGHKADFLVLESLYEGKDAVMEETRRSFHTDFRLAKLSYRIPVRNRSAIDPDAKARLLKQLEEEAYDSIITFSGFWVEFLRELMEVSPHYADRITAVHMDAGRSLSWKGTDRSGIKEIWLYRLDTKEILCALEPPAVSCKPENRILVHGGGWGIGEYDSKIRKLNELGYPLDIIVYYPEEAPAEADMNEYYLLDPEWKTEKVKDEYPRLLHYQNREWNEVPVSRKEANPLRPLIEQDTAILSKPGGGTISDSLVTGTPLLFSEELASYEKDNKLLWLDQGFGMEFESFAADRDRDEALKRMHERLLEANRNLPIITELL